MSTESISQETGEKRFNQAISRVSGLFKGAAHKAATPLLVTTMLASPFSASAQTHNVNLQNASAPVATSVVEGDYDCPLSAIGTRFDIPVDNQSKTRKEVVRTVTANRSSRGIVPAVYGNDRLLVQVVGRAVSDARNCGADIAGLVIGTSTEASGIDVYGGGLLLQEVGGIDERLDRGNASYVQEQMVRALLIADAKMKNTQVAELGGKTVSSPSTGF